MKIMTRAIMIVVLIYSIPFPALSQQNVMSILEKIKWQNGPSIADLGQVADVCVNLSQGKTVFYSLFN